MIEVIKRLAKNIQSGRELLNPHTSPEFQTAYLTINYHSSSPDLVSVGLVVGDSVLHHTVACQSFEETVEALINDVAQFRKGYERGVADGRESALRRAQEQARDAA